MNILQELISSLSTDDVKVVKVFLARANKGSQRKDILLFDHIRKTGTRYSDEKLITKLYPGGNRNAFFSLKSKLLADLSKYIMFSKINEDSHLRIMDFFYLGKFFESKNKNSLSLHYFNKAEKLALREDQDELLLMIYEYRIQKTNFHPFQNPEILIEKRDKVLKKLIARHEIEGLVNLIKFGVQNAGSQNKELSIELEKKVKKYTEENLNLFSSRTRFNLYQAIASLLIQRKKFHLLESYTRKVIDDFEKDGLFNKETHPQKLTMIIYLVNSLYNQKKYPASLKEAERLHEEMKAYKKTYYQKYLLFYLNSLLMNFSARDKNKALKLLLEWKNNSSIKNSEYYPIFINLNLALLYYSEGNAAKAIRAINNLYHHPLYHNFREELKMEINLTEMIIRFDTGDLDFLEIKLVRFEKDFGPLLSDSAFERQKMFLTILKEMSESQEWKRNKPLLAKIRKLISNPVEKEINKEFINYSDWLAKKSGITEK